MKRSSATAQTDGYQKTTLRNGLRVVSEKMSTVRSVSLGVWIDTGSRNENENESGVSHLVEHMVFKGTSTRSAKQIASSLESIGGYLNAFTSREQTCYLARILDEHLDTAVDVLSDITCRPSHTLVNLKREKGVILEEIKESLDNPSDHIYDHYSEVYWGDNPLGRPIMGSASGLSSIPRKRMLDYIKRQYRSSSIVVTAVGSVSHSKLVRLVRKHFDFPSGSGCLPEEPKRQQIEKLNIKTLDNNQTHVCIGFPGTHYASKHRTASIALGAYLGGGMSSVLFQKIREERGLVYSVFTYNDCYRDTGMFTTYLGTDHTHVKEAIEIILVEYRRMKKRKLSSLKLDQIKQQLKGQITLALESTSARMNRLGRQELVLGRHITLSETLNEIDQVTSSDILELANLFFDESQKSIAILGQADKSELDGV